MVRPGTTKTISGPTKAMVSTPNKTVSISTASTIQAAKDAQKFPTAQGGALAGQTVSKGTAPTMAQKIVHATPDRDPQETLKQELQKASVAMFQKLANERAAKEGRAPSELVVHYGSVPVAQTGTDKYEYAKVPLTGAGATTHEAVQAAEVAQRVLAKTAEVQGLAAATKTGVPKMVSVELKPVLAAQIAKSEGFKNEVHPTADSAPAAIAALAARDQARGISQGALVGQMLKSGQILPALGMIGLINQRDQATPTTAPTQQTRVSLPSTLAIAISGVISRLGEGVQSRVSARSGKWR